MRVNSEDFILTFLKKKNIISDKQSGKDLDRLNYTLLKDKVREGDKLHVKSIHRLSRTKEAIKDELSFFKEEGHFVHILNFPQIIIEVNDGITRA